MITEEQQSAYYKAPGHCPYCGAGTVERRSESDPSPDDPSQEVECDSCGRRWMEIYLYVQIEPISQKCSECRKLIRDGEHSTYVPHEYGATKAGAWGIYHIDCWEGSEEKARRDRAAKRRKAKERREARLQRA